MVSPSDSSAHSRRTCFGSDLFATVAELVEAVREFKRRYNEQWLIGRHRYRTPAQIRRGYAGSASEVA
jgi:hypothetical protein